MIRKTLILMMVFTFFMTCLGPIEDVQAQSMINLPNLGAMLDLSQSYKPLQIKGIKVYAQNPMKFDFLIDKGDSHLLGQPLKDEITRLTKYFLTCLTVPETDMWVNLSPYEKDRIVPGAFGVTQMGKDLLEQDYLLKTMVASSTYPEKPLGREFWQKVYQKAQELYGTTQIPVDTFNKVWIVPKSADVYVRGENAFVANSRLDVMLDTDYNALNHAANKEGRNASAKKYSQAYTQIFRAVILPQLRKEINEGRHFALVRQVYDAMILATWYKRHLKDSLLGKLYVGKNKISGVDLVDKNAKEKIFNQYVKSFYKHLYSYVREDYDSITQTTIPRKYTSGGMDFAMFGLQESGIYQERKSFMPTQITYSPNLAMASVNMTYAAGGKVLSFPDSREAPVLFADESSGQQRTVNAAMLGKTIVPRLATAVVLGMLGLSFGTFSASAGTIVHATPNSISVKVAKGDNISTILAAIVDPHFKGIKLAERLYGVDGKSGLVHQMSITDEQGRPLVDRDAISQNHVYTFAVADAPTVVAQLQQNPQRINQQMKIVVASTVGAAITSAPVVHPLEPLSVASPPAARATAPAPPAAVLLLPEPVVFTPAQTAALSNTAAELVTQLAVTDQMDLSGALSVSGLWDETSKDATQWVTAHKNDMLPGFMLMVVLGASLGGIIGGMCELWSKRKTFKSSLQAQAMPQAMQTQPRLGVPVVEKDVPAVRNEQEQRAYDLAAMKDMVASLEQGRGSSESENINAHLLAMQRKARAHLENAVELQPELEVTQELPRPGLWNRVLNAMALGGGVFVTAPMLGLGDWHGLWLSATVLAWMTGAMNMDWTNASSALRCGIIGLMMKIPEKGIEINKARPWLSWLSKATDFLTDRGGQQAGATTFFTNSKNQLQFMAVKKLKSKRGISREGASLVFYRNMINDLYGKFYKQLPRVFVPIYNHGRATVMAIYSHVRYATGGELVEDAAHPHSSAPEEKEIWIFDAAKGLIKKVMTVIVTIGHNGDNDASKVGMPLRQRLFGDLMQFGQMRRFFPAVVHKYYEGKITKGYLRKAVSNGQLDKDQTVRTNYGAVLKALRRKGWVMPDGYVNRRFIALDDEFKGWFEGYSSNTFDEIESALFGLPPGDSPIIPLQLHLYFTQGNWDASVRKTHVMINHKDIQQVMEDILFEDEEHAVGQIFSRVFEGVHKHLMREGFTPSDLDKPMSLRDLWVEDQHTARAHGLESQLVIIELFKKMLVHSMKTEAKKQTIAGEVLRSWEAKWQGQGEDADLMRSIFVDVVVKNFFTADRKAATMEFAERAEGTYGIFVRTSVLDDGVTLYSDNQDIAVGTNDAEGVIAFASDPRVLKGLTPDGKRLEEVMHLKNGEIVDMYFSPSGKIRKKSWLKADGAWSETAETELNKRFYPTAEVVNGTRNPYYATPPVEYTNYRRMIEEDLNNSPRVIAQAEREWERENSFNRQSTRHLAQRIVATYKKYGKVKLKVFGYDNSESFPQKLIKVLAGLVPNLEVEVIDANKFDEDPDNFPTTPDTIALVVSKSGATFPTKLAAMILKAQLGEENLFCMTARIDSVLNTIVGQGLRPEDPFTKRIFLTGEFYPSEAPVLSEILLLYQLNQLAFQLSRDLQTITSGDNIFNIRRSPQELQKLHELNNSYSNFLLKQLIGVDVQGQSYNDPAGKEMRSHGTYLGNTVFRSYAINRIMDVVIYGVFIFGGPLTVIANLFGGVAPYSMGDLTLKTLDFGIIRWLVGFGLAEAYNKLTGRPPFARLGEPTLFIAGDPVISETQENFFSRAFSNSLASTGPAGVQSEEPKFKFVTKLAHRVVRGGILLNFSLKHKVGETRMSIRQSTFPKTGSFLGLNWLKGRGEAINAVVEVPSGQSNEETEIIDQTIGIFGQIVAAKVIGVKMAMRASLGGRLWNPAHTFSRAAVHTTPTSIGVNDKVRRILTGQIVQNSNANNNGITTNVGAGVDQAMMRKGGIDMNSRNMVLKIHEEKALNNRIEAFNKAMLTTPIDGVVPQVVDVIAVTPGMLATMLGPPSLN